MLFTYGVYVRAKIFKLSLSEFDTDYQCVDANVTIEISALENTYARDKSIKKTKLEQVFQTNTKLVPIAEMNENIFNAAETY